MAWDIIADFEKMAYDAEPFAVTGAAFVVGGPEAAAVTANHYYNKRREKEHKKEQKRERDNYYVNMRKSAERGGFNPLTALRSGGGMGYQYAGTSPFRQDNSLGDLMSLMGGGYRRQVQREKLEIASLEAEIRLANIRADDLLKRAISKPQTVGVSNADAVLGFVDNGLNPQQEYEVEQSPIRIDWVETQKGPVNADQKALWHSWVDYKGFTRHTPYDPDGADGTEIIMAYVTHALNVLDHNYREKKHELNKFGFVAPGLDTTPLVNPLSKLKDFNIFSDIFKPRSRQSGGW